MNKFYVIFSVLLLIMSCRSETKTTNNDQDPEVEQISITDSLPLRLNAGKKWISNTETHEGIIKMKTIISTFEKESDKHYKVLGDSLAKQTSYIIKHCSMKGESHDQLHVVLIPMLDEISILREENNLDKSIIALQNLERLMAAYFKFFKV